MKKVGNKNLAVLMSSLALGFTASSVTASIITSFPYGGYDSSSDHGGSAILSPSGTELVISGREGVYSDTVYSMEFIYHTADNYDSITINWTADPHLAHNVSADYYFDVGDYPAGTFGANPLNVITSSTIPLTINAPVGATKIFFEVYSTESSGGKDPATLTLDIVPVPEPGTWLTGSLMLGAVGLSMLRRPKGASSSTL